MQVRHRYRLKPEIERKLKESLFKQWEAWGKRLNRFAPLRKTKPEGARTFIQRTNARAPKPAITGNVADYLPVIIKLIDDSSELKLWNELIERYHYLGYKVVFGARLHYFYITVGDEKHLAGCLQFSSPAWHVACRDKWIGWNDDTSKQLMTCTERACTDIQNRSSSQILQYQGLYKKWP